MHQQEIAAQGEVGQIRQPAPALAKQRQQGGITAVLQPELAGRAVGLALAQFAEHVEHHLLVVAPQHGHGGETMGLGVGLELPDAPQHAPITFVLGGTVDQIAEKDEFGIAAAVGAEHLLQQGGAAMHIAHGHHGRGARPRRCLQRQGGITGLLQRHRGALPGPHKARSRPSRTRGPWRSRHANGRKRNPKLRGTAFSQAERWPQAAAG